MKTLFFTVCMIKNRESLTVSSYILDRNFHVNYNVEDFYYLLNFLLLLLFYYLTTKTQTPYYTCDFKKGDFLVFGPETRGLPEELLNRNSKKTLNIPMQKGQRSLNLSNSVAIVLYEAIRQNMLKNSPFS